MTLLVTSFDLTHHDVVCVEVTVNFIFVTEVYHPSNSGKIKDNKHIY